MVLSMSTDAWARSHYHRRRRMWGTLRSLREIPVPGDGFAFYHSTRAIFPDHDRFKRKARLSLMGETAAHPSPMVAMSNTSGLRLLARYLRALEKLARWFGMKPTRTCSRRAVSFRALLHSLYHADHPTWATLVERAGGGCAPSSSDAKVAFRRRRLPGRAC